MAGVQQHNSNVSHEKELKVSKKLFIILILSICNLQTSFASCSNPTKADILLKKMFEKYQTSLKYSDKGHVYKIINGTEYTNEFSTQFEAPDKFTFTWKEKDLFSKKININKVWGENQTAYYLRHYNEKPEQKGYNSALSAAMGVSGGVSYEVLPWLLLHHDPCITINVTKNSVLNNDNNQLTDTYIIQRITKSGHVSEYWLSKKELLLRKVESKSSYQGKNFSTVITFDQVHYK